MPKDKRAAALKKRRRAERQAEQDREAERILGDFNEYKKSRGIKVKVSKKELYRMTHQVERELIAEAIIDSVIAVMYCLNAYCGFGQDRLFEYSRKIQRIITAIGQQTRPLDKLEDELISETGLDVRGLFKGYQAYGGAKQRSEAKKRACVIMTYAPNGIIMCLYVLYFDYGWKHKRMARIAEQVKDTIISNVENITMKELSTYLKNQCGICVHSDGNVERIEKHHKSA